MIRTAGPDDPVDKVAERPARFQRRGEFDPGSLLFLGLQEVARSCRIFPMKRELSAPIMRIP